MTQLYNSKTAESINTLTLRILKNREYSNLCKEIILPGYPLTTVSLNRLMPKYKFSRAKWYEADFDWVHQGEVLQWCKQQFGPHPARPDAWSRWTHKYADKIHFRDEKDYAWFMLRWGI